MLNVTYSSSRGIPKQLPERSSGFRYSHEWEGQIQAAIQAKNAKEIL